MDQKIRVLLADSDKEFCFQEPCYFRNYMVNLGKLRNEIKS